VTCDQQLVTLEWSEFMGGYNTPDQKLRDKRRKYVNKEYYVYRKMIAVTK